MSIAQDALAAQGQVDHRMGFALGELVLTKVDAGVLLVLSGQGILDLILGLEGDVGIDVAQLADGELHGLIRQGAAGEEAAIVLLGGSHLGGFTLDERFQLCLGHIDIDHIGRNGLALGESNRLAGSIFQVVSRGQTILLGEVGVAADEINHDGLDVIVALLGDGQDLLGHVIRGGLGEHDDDLGLGVVDECVEALLEHQTADFGLQVTAAGAQSLGDTGTELVDQDGELLGTGAGSAADTDGAAMDNVGESQRQTVDNGGTAVGTHHQQLLGNSILLELLFLFHRNVIAEQHDVDVLVQSVLGDIIGMTAGNGDQRQVDSGISLEGGGEGGRIVSCVAAFLFLVQLLLQCFEGSFNDLFVLAIESNEEIVGGDGFQLGAGKTGDLGDVKVQVSAHADQSFLYARDLLQLFGDDHQGNGVIVGVGFDLQINQCRFLLVRKIFLSQIYAGQDIRTGCFAEGDNIHRSRREPQRQDTRIKGLDERKNIRGELPAGSLPQKRGADEIGAGGGPPRHGVGEGQPVPLLPAGECRSQQGGHHPAEKVIGGGGKPDAAARDAVSCLGSRQGVPLPQSGNERRNARGGVADIGVIGKGAGLIFQQEKERGKAFRPAVGENSLPQGL